MKQVMAQHVIAVTPLHLGDGVPMPSVVGKKRNGKIPYTKQVSLTVARGLGGHPGASRQARAGVSRFVEVASALLVVVALPAVRWGLPAGKWLLLVERTSTAAMYATYFVVDGVQMMGHETGSISSTSCWARSRLSHAQAQCLKR